VEKPSEVNWGIVALQLQEEALRRWIAIPVLRVRDRCTGQETDVYVDQNGNVVGYIDEMAALFRRGFARDWLKEAQELRLLVVRRQNLLNYVRLAS
jgi:hypothetical protein